ncbi:MAG: hypothetical protein WDN28_12945 [Chthoniobacter sp.]
MRNGRIGLVDDPRVGVARFHRRQRRPHIVARQHARPELFPQAHPGQEFTRIDPRGHRLRLAQGKTLDRLARQRHRRVDFQGAIHRDNDHETVPQQWPTGTHHDQILAGERIHLRFIGGHENIRRRPFLDLPGQRARRPQIEHHMIPRRRLVRAVDLLERIGEAGGGRDIDIHRTQRGESGGQERTAQKEDDSWKMS